MVSRHLGSSPSLSLPAFDLGQSIYFFVPSFLSKMSESIPPRVVREMIIQQFTHPAVFIETCSRPHPVLGAGDATVFSQEAHLP